MFMKELSKRQFEVMNIIWENKAPMIASEITACKKDLNLNTVQSVLRSLLKKGFIEISDIVYSGKVLTRSYRAVILKQEYIDFISNILSQKYGQKEIIAAFVNEINDSSKLAEIMSIVDLKKKELKD